MENACPICLEEVFVFNESCMALNCCHLIHRECFVLLQQNIEKLCPLCREPVKLDLSSNDWEHFPIVFHGIRDEKYCKKIEIFLKTAFFYYCLMNPNTEKQMFWFITHNDNIIGCNLKEVYLGRCIAFINDLYQNLHLYSKSVRNLLNSIRDTLHISENGQVFECFSFSAWKHTSRSMVYLKNSYKKKLRKLKFIKKWK